ncbi:ExbD/TolR family protein [Lysobacter cavernae]|uniref:ExbD/TolR family protein n=1 Tax=Lysobacter cavernae TaxID=1685901 RepID=A0ABV7RWH3_9GAMM
MTPLVDVLLVLLVIFMVTAPVLSGRLDLRLPQVPVDPQPLPPAPRSELLVRHDGSFQLDGRGLTSSELQPALQALAARAPRTVLHVGAEAEADYQGFARAVSAAKHSGLNDIALR